jgi:hypothetical protein
VFKKKIWLMCFSNSSCSDEKARTFAIILVLRLKTFRLTTMALLSLLSIAFIEGILKFISSNPAPRFVFGLCDFSTQHLCLALGIYHFLLEGLPTLLLLVALWSLLLRKLKVPHPFFIVLSGFFLWILLFWKLPLAQIYLMVGTSNLLYYVTSVTINVLLPYSLAYLIGLLLFRREWAKLKES